MAINLKDTVQIIRGKKTDIAARTGANGELNWADDTYELYIHDGKTRGGHLIGKASGTAGVVGGAGIAVSTSDGISTVSIKRDPTNVLYATTDGAGVRIGTSGALQITAQNALDLRVAEGGGLIVDSNGVKIDSAVLSSVFRYAGQVNSVDDLPSDAQPGDVYDVKDSGANYVWSGTSWDNLGGIMSVDASPTQGSTNPVASGGVYDAIQDVKLYGDGTTVTVVNNIISVPEYEGATADTAATSGLVPPAAAGDQNKYLGGDGEWHEIIIPSEVVLSDSVASDSSTTAASSKAVKTAYDRASTAITNASTAKSAADAAQEAADAAQTTADAAQDAAEAAQNTVDSVQTSLNQAVDNITQQITALTKMQDFVVTDTAIDVDSYAGSFSKVYLTSSATASTGLPSGISYPCFFWTERAADGDTAMMYVLSDNVLYSQSGVNTTPDGDTDTWTFNGWQKITYTAATTSALGVVKPDGTTVEVTADGTLSINTNLLSQVYKFKGSVATVDDLPTGAAQGDVYNVTATDANYAWTGSAWDNIGGIAAVDSSPVQNSTNPVSSGGVYTALENLQTDLEGQITASAATPDGVTIANNSANKLMAQDVAIGGDASDLASMRGIFNSLGIGAQDFNNLKKQGIYSIPNTDSSNGPGFSCRLVVLSTNGSIVNQIAIGEQRLSYRYYQNDSWTAWRLILADNTIGGGITVNNGIISVPEYEGATADTAATSGLVPPAAAGQQEYYLSGDGNWRELTSGMPVGSIYIQFSGQSAPSDLFGGAWSNISNSYAGLFFRAEGGAAAAFGGSQTGGLPALAGSTGYQAFGPYGGSFYASGIVDPTSAHPASQTADSSVLHFNASRSSSLYGAATEVRPVNSTIRIWKRTA